MGMCKSCNKVANVIDMRDGICLDCQNPEIKKQYTTDKLKEEVKLPSAIGWLGFASWMVLIASLIAGVFIMFTMSYIEVPYGYVSGSRSQFSMIGIIYGLGIMFNGIFLSSLGFTVSYIARTISDKELNK